MERIKLPKKWPFDTILTSNYCKEHTYIKDGVEHVKLCQMMMVDGIECCPKCVLNKINMQFEADILQKYMHNFKRSNYNILFKKSILLDKTILNATFDTYKAETTEEKSNKLLCLQIVERFKNGQIFNVLLQGNQGAGKSHLAYSLLRKLNDVGEDVTCLFVSVEEMMRLIKETFNNKESKYTEQYFLDLLSSVDYLVLDDIGAETGAIDTSKIATDFVQRVLYAVTNSRQDKVTISTTNLDSNKLFTMYDKKLISRLLKNPKYVLFKETTDKRMLSLPF
ncbi:ATP-binding protein [Paenisporosarcina indica]|uniref:ATP-binding protein n=1 Tax=Paenisporosarcina indica TaxID=650093 RepID=UPI00094F844C|nr:ATP-binding protein [Paenisporosarcina indica]